jgi:hypothetical protein
MPDTKTPTRYEAFALRRASRILSRWIEIGHAEGNGPGTIHHVFLDQLPIGGFTGHICLVPPGVAPPEPGPERPIEEGGG